MNETLANTKVGRRGFLAVPALSMLVPAPHRVTAAEHPNPFERVGGQPDSVLAFAEGGQFELVRDKDKWHSGSIVVEAFTSGTGAITLQSPTEAPLRLRLRWQITGGEHLTFCGDAWERSYGDLAWRNMDPERILPWYFLGTNGGLTVGCGVRTGAGAFAFWQVDPSGVSLWLDVRNGGSGVQLGDRKLELVSIHTAAYEGISAFSAASRFCGELCPSPRLPQAPVYGGNNWYYAYGHSSASDILADSGRMASVAASGANRPFMVIDDGWQPNPTAGPWSAGNARFPDMAKLAEQMVKTGVQPGLWFRPLFTKERVDENWRLSHPNAAREYTRHGAFTLDPTVPEVAAKIRDTTSALSRWGYRLLKHDFSTYDLFGRWGFTMGAEITDAGWHFADEAKTNAEIIRDLYGNIRQGAGEALVLGCNTVGHIAAGLFELQRTGDDTSGRDWNRTRKMGVNTLAFRACQHNTFFAIDADCVGLTKQIPWPLNRQWLELLAFSGTPLFVSAAPDALGPEQRDALRRAFETASVKQTTAEPLDWLQNTEPAKWRNEGETRQFDWWGENGSSPFSH